MKNRKFIFLIVYFLSFNVYAAQWGGVDLNDPDVLNKIIQKKLSFEHENYDYLKSLIIKRESITEDIIEAAITNREINAEDFKTILLNIANVENKINYYNNQLAELNPETEEYDVLRDEIDHLYILEGRLKDSVGDFICLDSYYLREFLNQEERESIEMLRDRFLWDELSIKRAAEHALVLVPDEHRLESIKKLTSDIDSILKTENEKIVTKNILFKALSVSFQNNFGKQLLDYLNAVVR